MDRSEVQAGSMAAASGDRVDRKTSQLAVEQQAQKLIGPPLLWQQIKALNKKNFLIRFRAWKTNLLLVAQAVLFITLTWGVDKAVLASNQRRPAFSNEPQARRQIIPSIPDCSSNMFMRQDERCYTLLYAPKGVRIVESIISAVANNNQPPIPREHLRGFDNGSALDAHLLAHPNTVLAALEFTIDDVQGVGFAVQTNSSVQWFKGNFQDPNLYIQLPVQVAVEREVVRVLTAQPQLSWTAAVTQFPHPSAKSPSAIAKFAPTFLFASIMFQFVLQLHDILHEKESGVRQLMTVMGLRDAPFWVCCVGFQALLSVMEACLLVGFAHAFRFNLFTRNAFSLGFLLILEVSLAMASFGFLVACFLRKAASAVPVGFFLFVVAWVFLIVISFGFPYSTKYSIVAVAAFSAFPWTLLGKGVADLAAASDAHAGGMTWADRTVYCQATTPSPALQGQLNYWQTDCVMPLSDIYVALAIQCVAYLGLAIYFDNVLPDENGVCRRPWYFVQLAHWFPKKKANTKRAARALDDSVEASEHIFDPDVQAECQRLRARCRAYVQQAGANDVAVKDGPAYAVQMYGMRKAYMRSRRLFHKRKQFVAVHGNWLGIQEGECFCLLGPNGAGKTTTISCLTGLIPFTAGDALVYSDTISTPAGLSRVRPLMGICPQFDTGLWELLTGREHLLLFAAIKGIPPSLQASEAAKLLEDVKLTEAAEVTVGAYSGGMKRRLSVAMALLGNPKVVYLDEPTTGLDPLSRRHLWDLIDRTKQTRAIILTTHSMEEADILGDRIAIMARGRLRCIGTSLHLKTRFGSGYRVSVRVHGGAPTATVIADIDENSPCGHAADVLTVPGMCTAGPPNQRDPVAVAEMAHIKQIFMQRLGVKSADESLDYVHFLVPYEHEDKLPLIFSYLKAHATELGVADVQLRLTPLEEVFLNVSRKAELEHAQAEGQYEMLTLAEENVAVQVPVGAEFIQSPGGYLYHIKWVQDDKGNLKMQDYWRDPVSTAALAARTAGESRQQEGP